MAIKNYSDHAANERTFLAWLRIGLAVVAFGIVVEKLTFLLTAVLDTMPPRASTHTAVTALARLRPDLDPPTSAAISVRATEVIQPAPRTRAMTMSAMTATTQDCLVSTEVMDECNELAKQQPVPTTHAVGPLGLAVVVRAVLSHDLVGLSFLWGWFLALGVLLVIVGMAAIAFPVISTIAAKIAMG